MTTLQEAVKRMRDSLTLSDPGWDVSVGTPEYKILEAVAQELIRAEATGFLNSYHFDVWTKVGAELDDFVAMFGLSRLQGTRATGTVKFLRGTAAVEDHFIPAGQQVYKPQTTVSPLVMFQTVSSATLSEGGTEIEVPIEAVVAGTSGNTASGTIVGLGTQPGGVTAVVNDTATAGGRPAESDTDLRIRWQRTVFRNLAGTEDQFLALALENPEVVQASVIGPVKRYREQIEVVTGTAQSQLVGSKYTYPGGEFVGYDLDTIGEEIGIPGSDYTIDDAVPPEVTIIDAGLFPDGEVIEVEHEYCPSASRNDPDNGVLHKIDLFISGQDVQEVTEEVVMDYDKVVTTGSGTWGQDNWIREDGTTKPAQDHYLMPLYRTPIVTLPDQIETWELGTDYWLVRDVTNLWGSTICQDAIEWSDSSPPPDDTALEIVYTYNKLVTDIQSLGEGMKLVGFDFLVHEAKYVYLKFHLSVVYDLAANESTVNAEMSTALTDWLESKAFVDNVQVADMIDVLKEVSGVDNVRLTTSTEDGSNYGIQVMAEDGTTELGSPTMGDLYFTADQLPILHSTVVLPRGNNTF